jgi:hypothetical protein
MNISEVAAAERKAAERDKGKADTAVAMGSLPAAGMDTDFAAGGEGRCGFLGPAICAM